MSRSLTRRQKKQLRKRTRGSEKSQRCIGRHSTQPPFSTTVPEGHRVEIVDIGGQQMEVTEIPGNGISFVSLEYKEKLASLASLARPGGRRINRWTTEDDLNRDSFFTFDQAGLITETHASARRALAQAGDHAGNEWLWCLHCERFFQAQDLKQDRPGSWQCCPFNDCGAAGLDVDILVWNAYQADDPRWPKTQDELTYGLRL